MDESILVQVFLPTVEKAFDVGLSNFISVEEVLQSIQEYYDEIRKEEEPVVVFTKIYHVEKNQVLKQMWTVQEAGIKNADCLYIF